MRASEAARVIGMSIAQMRQACRKRLIPSKKKKNPLTPGAHIYELKEKDVLWYKDHRPKRGPKKEKEQPNGRSQGERLQST